MARVKPVYKAADFPGMPDEGTAAALKELFAQNAEFDKAHTGMAVAALNPKLALNLGRMSRFIAVEMPWSQHQQLHELAIQTLNQHFNCVYSIAARAPRAESLGLSKEILASIPQFRSSALFSDEQKLIIEFTYAVISGAVPAEVFKRVAAAYGEAGAVELTSAIAWWSFWAMLINATIPGADPDSQ